MLLRLGGAENRKYRRWLLQGEVLAATHGDLYANHSLRGSGEYLQSCEERGNIGRPIERFYARNLPLSKETAINLQSFGSA